MLVSYDLNGRERPSAYTAVRKVIESNAKDFKKIGLAVAGRAL